MRARDNPFSTDRVLRIRYEPRGATWDELLTRFVTLGFRGAVIGHHGAGKTTFVEDFAERLPSLGLQPRLVWLHDRSGREERRGLFRVAAGLAAGDCLILDGAEQLGWLQWRRLRWLARRTGGLLITQHARGRLPTFWRCETDVELLADIVCRLQPEAGGKHSLAKLYRQHRGNLREVLRTLYDRAAEEIRGG